MENKKLAFISEKMPPEIAGIFENLGYGCVRLLPHEALDTPVAHHPDMLFSVLDSGDVLCDEDYLRANPFLLELGVSFRPSSAKLGKKYPQDIAFDALVIDGVMYGKTSFAAPEILQNRKTVNVKQGYAQCSTLVTDRVAITGDSGIYDALIKNGVNALKISADGIALDGYSCGFIGGASAYDKDSETVIFFGDITKHPDYEKINAFLKQNGHQIAFSDSIPLTDFGGAKLIQK